ncbi:MAG: hypothetical protein HAW67_03195 [Endozoicomonadaceae bacterium]|nr:hypothetical protein [Endozoicomonadaceae bacterium]
MSLLAIGDFNKNVEIVIIALFHLRGKTTSDIRKDFFPDALVYKKNKGALPNVIKLSYK